MYTTGPINYGPPQYNSSLEYNPEVHHLAMDSSVRSVQAVWQSSSRCRDLSRAATVSPNFRKCGSRSSNLVLFYTAVADSFFQFCWNHEQYSYVLLLIFKKKKKLKDVPFFVFLLYKTKRQCFFCLYFSVFAGTSHADCGLGHINPDVDRPRIPSLPPAACTSTRSIMGDFVILCFPPRQLLPSKLPKLEVRLLELGQRVREA